MTSSAFSVVWCGTWQSRHSPTAAGAWVYLNGPKKSLWQVKQSWGTGIFKRWEKLDSWHSRQRTSAYGLCTTITGAAVAVGRATKPLLVPGLADAAPAVAALVFGPSPGTPSKKMASHWCRDLVAHPAPKAKPKHTPSNNPMPRRTEFMFGGRIFPGQHSITASGFFLAKTKDADFPVAQLVGDDDQVFQLEIRRRIFLEKAHVLVIDSHFGGQVEGHRVVLIRLPEI